MVFKEISLEWYEGSVIQSREFAGMASCVTLMVERLMGGIKDADFWRLNIQCRSSPCDERLTMGANGFRTAILGFDPAPMFDASDFERKKCRLK